MKIGKTLLHVLGGLMEKGRNRAKRKTRARKKIIEVALWIWVLEINPIFLSAKYWIGQREWKNSLIIAL